MPSELELPEQLVLARLPDVERALVIRALKAGTFNVDALEQRTPKLAEAPVPTPAPPPERVERARELGRQFLDNYRAESDRRAADAPPPAVSMAREPVVIDGSTATVTASTFGAGLAVVVAMFVSASGVAIPAGLEAALATVFAGLSGFIAKRFPPRRAD